MSTWLGSVEISANNRIADQALAAIRSQVANEIADWIMAGVVDDAHGGELLKQTMARQIRKRYSLNG